jgi:hypothetical protein
MAEEFDAAIDYNDGGDSHYLVTLSLYGPYAIMEA